MVYEGFMHLRLEDRLDKVIELYRAVAECPKCKGQKWFIHLNGLRQEFTAITKHECCECGHSVDIRIEVEKEGVN